MKKKKDQVTFQLKTRLEIYSVSYIINEFTSSICALSKTTEIT